MFTAISFDADGCGWIRSDRFGLSPVYRADASDLAAYANRPALLAALVGATTGSVPDRDVDTIRHVAVLGTAFRDRSGFVGIERIPDRHDVDFDAGVDRVVETWEHPWPADDPGPADLASTISDVRERLVAGMRSLVAASSTPVEAELTSGTDSRLVLAVARLAGVQDELRFHTFGPPDADDARVAQQLSLDLGLRWEMRRARTTAASPEAFLGRIQTTSGEFGAGGLVPPSSGTLLLSGIMGEALSVRYNNFAPRFALHAVRRQGRVLAQVQPYARRSAIRRTVRDVHRDLWSSARAGCAPATLIDAFYLRQRDRRWVGGRPDRWDRNLFPLYSPTAIVANLRLALSDRQSSALHRSIIGAAGLPFSTDPAGLPAARPPDDSPTAEASLQPVLLELVAACRESPGCEFVDHDLLRSAVERYPTLARKPRQKAIDALTALLWSDPRRCPTFPS